MIDYSHRDRAATITTALIQIVRTVSEAALRQPIENYLRDELADLERQIAAGRSCPDA